MISSRGFSLLSLKRTSRPLLEKMYSEDDDAFEIHLRHLLFSYNVFIPNSMRSDSRISKREVID